MSVQYMNELATDTKRAFGMMVWELEQADVPGLRADQIGIRGVWTPQVEALFHFDIKVIDTDGPSHLHRTLASILDSGALEKKKLILEDRRGTFTPFVTSVDGLLHREAEHFLKHVATSIAAKWEKSYAETCAFVRARFGSSIKLVSKGIKGTVEEWTRL